MSLRVAPLFAGLAAGVVLSVAAPACSDIDQALNDYCKQNETTAPDRLAVSCQKDGDCCAGWSCLSGTCARAMSADSGNTEDAGTDADSGTIEDGGSDVGEDAGVYVDGGASCLPPDTVCTSADECCAEARFCLENDIGVAQCRASLCRELEASCSDDDECCSGQCLGPQGEAKCAATNACVVLGTPCLDSRDCCGAGVCTSDGTKTVCTAPVSQGVEVGGGSCDQDSVCSSGQCLNSLCDAVESCSQGPVGGCMDLTDCCGGLRCNASTGTCVAPVITSERSCSGTGIRCGGAKECCGNSCIGGVCS